MENKTEKKITELQNLKQPVPLSLDFIAKIDSSLISNPVGISFKGDTLYISEYNSDKIKIFDNYGTNIINSIEIPDNYIISSFNIFNESALISSLKDRKVFNYDFSGRRMSEIETDLSIPEKVTDQGNGDLFGTFITGFSGKADTYFVIDLKSVDKNFGLIKLMSSFSGSYLQGNIDPETELFPFAVNRRNNTVYISCATDRSYSIFCYSPELELRSVIRSRYGPVSFTDGELKRLSETTVKFRMPPFSAKTKILIESMFVCSSGYLWVRRAVDGDIFGNDVTVFDIFGPDDKYITAVSLEGVKRYERIYEHGGRLYIADPFSSVIRIYQYSDVCPETSK